MGEVSIRPYVPSDEEALVNIMRHLTPKYFLEEEVKDYQGYLRDKVEDYFVIIKDQMVVGGGGLNYFPEDDIVRISWDLISKDHQSEGLGKQLFQHRIDHLQSKGSTAQVIVRTSDIAQGFYMSLGFTPLQYMIDGWGKGMDMVVMEWTK